MTWTKDRIIDVLLGNDWFARQPADFREHFLRYGRVRHFSRGQWLHAQGDQSTGLIAVLQGHLRLEANVNAKPNTLCDLLGPTAIIGQSASFGGGPRLITAVSANDMDALLLSDIALRRISAITPLIGQALLELMFEQLQRNVRIRVEWIALAPKDRLLTIINHLNENLGNSGYIKISQEDLADMCGISRKSVNIHISRFKKDGLLSTKYKCVELH